MNSYTARRLPVQCGPAGWNALLAAQPAARPLTEDSSADFVIVGAGFAGLSAARRLTQLEPNARVAILEAGRIAEGSAGRNSGFMIDLPHDVASDNYLSAGDDRLVTTLNRQAISFAGDAVQEYGIRPGYFDARGKINGAASASAQAHNENYGRHLAALGERYEMLDGAQMAELTGSRYYVGGLYTPGTVLVQPAGYVRGLAAGLAARGVEIFEDSPVMAFTREGTSWRVKAPGGSISTARVILTVNGHLESFGFERGRLMHVFLFAVMTPELDETARAKLGGAPHWGITPSDPMGTTVRRIDAGQGGNRIVTRSCATLRPNTRPTEGDLARAVSVMREKFDQRFPQLAGLAMEYAWAGLLCLTRNGASIMREVADGVFSGCAQNGLGVARGTLTGIGAAELACGQQSAITRYFSAQPRPPRLPPQPLQEIGGNAILRWKEWQARAE